MWCGVVCVGGESHTPRPNFAPFPVCCPFCCHAGCPVPLGHAPLSLVYIDSVLPHGMPEVADSDDEEEAGHQLLNLSSAEEVWAVERPYTITSTHLFISSFSKMYSCSFAIMRSASRAVCCSAREGEQVAVGQKAQRRGQMRPQENANRQRGGGGSFGSETYPAPKNLEPKFGGMKIKFE